MIKKLRIKNFKCYGPQGADFNLSKVNFIYGDNSVGKSSFLQFLEQFVKQIDYKNQYDRKAFDRFAFKGHGPVSARVRAVTETSESSVECELAFQPAQGNECYETTVKDGIRICPEFWDSILPKNGGNERIVHWPSKSEFEKDYAGASALESAGFLTQVEMRSMDDRGAEYLDDLLNRIGVPYSCVKDSDGQVSRDSIRDMDFGIDVPLHDVGWGIQRIFRLAFALKDWQAGILVLEEPESNVDEAQLGALTRVLVEEALKRPHGQLIVECHSELMVMMLKNLLAHGVVTPAQLSVTVVTKEMTGSSAKQIQFDEFGNMTTSWPKGYFSAASAILDAYYKKG